VRTRRDRGFAWTGIVFGFALATGAFVVASETDILPFHREQERLESSDQALALAESGVAWARLHREDLEPTPLGNGHVSVRVESRSERELVVVATGVARAPRLGGAVTRRIRARFAVDGGKVSVLDWKEL
jgi:hypothetical protein